MIQIRQGVVPDKGNKENTIRGQNRSWAIWWGNVSILLADFALLLALMMERKFEPCGLIATNSLSLSGHIEQQSKF